MTRRRWIADEFTDSTAALVGQNAAHLARVLRARVGDLYDVACGDELRLGTISSVGDERVEFTLGDLVEAAEELRPITILMAIYKFDRMEWAIEKCTELGAARIIPVIARRTDAHLALASSKRVERWRRIAHEAAQQSRGSGAPSITEPRQLAAAIATEAPLRLLLNENERSKKISEIFTADASEVAIAVGPEGGWTGEELSQFDSAGWQSVTLGSRILRAETAAIAALSVAAALAN
jgi:16S rRNA (uracil1498-N3)-methyltransferase